MINVSAPFGTYCLVPNEFLWLLISHEFLSYFLWLISWNSSYFLWIFMTYDTAKNELVMLNFYADWCRFSQMLAPIWDEFAEKLSARFPEEGKVVVGKVDCDNEAAISTRWVQGGGSLRIMFLPKSFLASLGKLLNLCCKNLFHQTIKSVSNMNTEPVVRCSYLTLI